MQMRLLNLARSTDRLALFRARNPHAAHLVHASAVDGATVDRAALIAHDVMVPTLRYTDGALGNALSHLRLWRDAVQSGEAFTVVEDDAILCANFANEMERVVRSLPDDWDYVMWGYNFDNPITYHLGPNLSQSTAVFSQDALRADGAGFSGQAVTTRPMRLLRGFGTMAYSVSPRGAERLINFCLPLRPLTTVHPGLAELIQNRRIDNMLAHAWPSMSAFVALPPLAVTENDAEASTVLNGGARSNRGADDAFPLAAFAPIVRALGGGSGVAIGVRARHDATLATSGLRTVGWGGFDIAVDPAKLDRALRDRAVEPGFDLLHVGSGCPVPAVLAATLEAWRPRVVVLPPERSSAADASCWRAGSGSAANAKPPVYAALAAAQGYAMRRCLEAPGHIALFRPDVPAPDAAVADCDKAAEGGRTLVADGEVVRLWH